MERTKWTERKFTFDFPAGWMQNILERLRGTPARISAITSGLSDEDMKYRPPGKWSLKEHIGHLSDLEDLHEGRIEDFLQGKDILRAADMSNAKTYAADHQAKPVMALILELSEKRERFVMRLENLDDKTQRSTALHPRLQIPMRPVDMACFTAEHDDHHLADMRSIIKELAR